MIFVFRLLKEWIYFLLDYHKIKQFLLYYPEIISYYLIFLQPYKILKPS